MTRPLKIAGVELRRLDFRMSAARIGDTAVGPKPNIESFELRL